MPNPNMSHITITTIILISSVVLAEWSTSVMQEISPSCRSRYQTERDIKELEVCVAQIVEKFKIEIDEYNEKLCDREITGCFRTLATIFKPCLTVERYNDIFENPLKAVKGGIDYVCSYKSQPLRVKSQAIKLSTCFIDASNMCEDSTVKDFIKNLSLEMLNQTP
uniref:DUF19 domain-containing protein n=1 Tax=Strigamia maritima TaxID=126957 RepID=T1J5L4_STRMM